MANYISYSCTATYPTRHSCMSWASATASLVSLPSRQFMAVGDAAGLHETGHPLGAGMTAIRRVIEGDVIL